MTALQWLGELKRRNHMQGRIQVVIGHRVWLWGIDWAAGQEASAWQQLCLKQLPLNKDFQLTAHLSGRVMNGLGVWEARMCLQSKKSLYSRKYMKRKAQPPVSWYTVTDPSKDNSLHSKAVAIEEHRVVANDKEFHNSMNVFTCKPHGITWFHPLIIPKG